VGPPTEAELAEWEKLYEGYYPPGLTDEAKMILRLIAEVRRLRGEIAEVLRADEWGRDHSGYEEHEAMRQATDKLRRNMGLPPIR